MKENSFKVTKERSRRYPAQTVTDVDYADDTALLANTPTRAETLLHSLEWAAAGIGLHHVNAYKTEYMCFNQRGDISTLNGSSLKLADKFTYLGSSVSSTEDINTRLAKAWTAIDRLLVIWKSDLTDKMKRSSFQAAIMLILLYRCTTWMLTKRIEKKLDGNYTKMLQAILNKPWGQHPTKQQLYSQFLPITKTIQVRRTRHVGHCWRSRNKLISNIPLHMDEQRQNDQLEPSYNSSVQIQDVDFKTYRKQWTIEKGGGRGSEAWHDDNVDYGQAPLSLIHWGFQCLRILTLSIHVCRKETEVTKICINNQFSIHHFLVKKILWEQLS